MHNICGILITKKNSKRFPVKNRLLFKDNLKIMIEAVGKENTYMFTDDAEIADFCLNNDIKVIWKGLNIDDETSYLDVLRYAFMYINNKKYDVIATVICNSINHTSEKIIEAIHKLIDQPESIEIRSFDDKGNQSGIFVFRAEKFPDKWHHQGMIISNGREIHYESDLDKIKH